MSASLVGSEMCIRDSTSCPRAPSQRAAAASADRCSGASAAKRQQRRQRCLLYTSDAADDM
eukprot:2669254-Alexandrium_andersonii.AAC.1